MTKQNNLKKNILDKINKGELKMKPKVYFTVKAIFVLIVIIVAIISMSFLISFAVFSIKESSRLFLLGFGSIGVWTFLTTFPWFLLIIEIVSLFLVDILLTHFKFAYKTPFIYLIIITSIFVVFVSVFISATPIHETLYQEVIEQRLPALKTMYINIKRPPNKRGVFRGVVTSIDDDMFTIYSYDEDKDDDDGHWTVFIPKSKLKYVLSSINIGDLILTACSKEKDGRCYVYGIKNFGLPKVK